MRCQTFQDHDLERAAPILEGALFDLLRRQPDSVRDALEPLLTDERKQRIEEVLQSRVPSVVVVLDHLRDPHNRAAILRTSEALGLQEIHAIGPEERWPLSRRVTQGCHKWLDVMIHQNATSCVEALTSRDFVFVEATEKARGESSKLDSSQPVALCLGNEHAGLTEELRRHCTGKVEIPMRGFTRSLNVSVAAALLIDHLIESRPRGFDQEREALLRARYYALSVRSPLEVLRKQGVL